MEMERGKGVKFACLCLAPWSAGEEPKVLLLDTAHSGLPKIQQPVRVRVSRMQGGASPIQGSPQRPVMWGPLSILCSTHFKQQQASRQKVRRKGGMGGRWRECGGRGKERERLIGQRPSTGQRERLHETQRETRQTRGKENGSETKTKPSPGKKRSGPAGKRKSPCSHETGKDQLSMAEATLTPGSLPPGPLSRRRPLPASFLARALPKLYPGGRRKKPAGLGGAPTGTRAPFRGCMGNPRDRWGHLLT